MRTQETFQAWLEWSKETLRLSAAAAETGDYSKVDSRDAEGQRLWEVCLADGWAREEGNRALAKEELSV